MESYLFPAPALREALLNTVVHKDYSSGNPVQISVYEDKIIFWNVGRLPDELSLERTGETGKISPETTPKNRGKTREKILKLILEDTSISIEEMSNRIGITQKGIEWQIMRLKKDRILERIGPARGGYWKVIEKKL